MDINRQSSIGKKGSTIVYQVENFRFDEVLQKVKWDPFRVYVPGGPLDDDEGNQYYEVEAGEISLARDPDLDREIVVKITPTEVLYYETYIHFYNSNGIKYYDSEARFSIQVGDQETLFATILIPSNISQEITCTLVEVLEEQ